MKQIKQKKVGEEKMSLDKYFGEGFTKEFLNVPEHLLPQNRPKLVVTVGTDYIMYYRTENEEIKPNTIIEGEENTKEYVIAIIPKSIDNIQTLEDVAKITEEKADDMDVFVRLNQAGLDVQPDPGYGAIEFGAIDVTLNFVPLKSWNRIFKYEVGSTYSIPFEFRGSLRVSCLLQTKELAEKVEEGKDYLGIGFYKVTPGTGYLNLRTFNLLRLE